MASQPPRSNGKLYGVPDLPPHYLPREADLAGLKRKLLSGDASVAITGQGKAVGIQGMGGIGKTVLAAALAHDSEVRQAFPDGIYWLTVGQKPNLLDLHNQLLHYTDSVNALAVTPDGRFVVSGSFDNTLRVWNLATGKIKTTLQGHMSYVFAVAITPDSRHVVSGSSDKTLRVWDLVTGETKTTLQGHTDSVHAVAVTPDSRYVVSGSSDKTLRVWDLKTGETKTTLQGHTGSVWAVAVTLDRRYCDLRLH
jgi:hypothetical protein